MKNKTTLAVLGMAGAIATLAGCATTTRTTIREYEYTNEMPERQQPLKKSEYEMVSPETMTSPGRMVSPTDPPR